MSAPPAMMDPHCYRPDLKRPLEMENTSAYSPASDRTTYTPIPRSATPTIGRQPQQDPTGAKRIKIDDLLLGSSTSASQPLSPASSELATSAPAPVSTENFKSVYSGRYAPAVDDFLESGWFSTAGWSKISSDNQLAEVMAEVFERFRARGGSYCEEEDPAIRKGGKDADLLWAAIKLCYGTRIPVSDNRRDEDDRTDGVLEDEGAEAFRRIRVIESLLTRRAEYAPASPQLSPSDKPGEGVGRGGQFWYQLEKIATFQRTGPDSDKEISILLEECRSHLEKRHNRELLHAIAELHHLHGEASVERRDALREYITTIAQDRAHSINNLASRIAGRAVGLWADPVTDVSFCMQT